MAISPDVERLVRWVIKRLAPLMADATRWKVEIAGKGPDYTCSVTVYEDP